MFGFHKEHHEPSFMHSRREECRHRGRFGGRHHGGREFGFRGFGGGGRERMFESGDLQLILLSLLAEKPSYGYELIKTMEQKLGGGYAPSPGAIYPTLTMLEEEGFISASTREDGKKVFEVTQEGRVHLEQNKSRLSNIESRMEETGGAFRQGRSPQIMRAFMNLGNAVRLKATAGRLSQEQIKQIAAAIDAAAKSVDEI